MINQLTNPNKLINSFIETIIQCVSLLNMRIQYRSASEDHKEYKNSELLKIFVDLYVIVSVFSSTDSDFNLLNVSSLALDKENIIKLHELILNNISIWLEFPNSQEFLVLYLYGKVFGELYKRPAVLYLLSSLIKLCSFSDKACKESLLKILIPSNQKDESLKKEKFGVVSLTPKEKIIEVIMFRNFFWDSKYMMLANLHFIEAVLSLQDHDIVVAVYNVFERNLKTIYDEIKGDIQEENMMQVRSLLFFIFF